MDVKTTSKERRENSNCILALKNPIRFFTRTEIRAATISHKPPESCKKIHLIFQLLQSIVNFFYRNVIPLPNLTKDGFRITVNKLMNNDAGLFDVEAVVKYFIMMGDLRLYTETPISGDIYIMDLGNNLTVSHLVKGANSIIRKAFTIATEVYPQRIKKIHVVNAPNIVDKFLVLMKSLMKEKLRQRVRL